MKIIARKPAPTFEQRLEQRARHATTPESPENPAQAQVHGRIALALNQLDRTRACKRQVLASLVRVECYIRNELRGMERRTPKYSPDRFPEREKLQRRLGELAKEERTHQVRFLQQEHELHEKLLTTLEEHTALTTRSWNPRSAYSNP